MTMNQIKEYKETISQFTIDYKNPRKKARTTILRFHRKNKIEKKE